MGHEEKALQYKEALLRFAGQSASIQQLSELAKVGRTSIYRYCAEDEVFHKEIETLMKKTIIISETFKKSVKKLRAKTKKKKPKGKTVIVKARPVSPVTLKPVKQKKKPSLKQAKKEVKMQTVTIEVPVKDDPNRKRNNDAERVIIAEQICKLLETNVSLDDACFANKISSSTFIRWTMESSPLYNEHIALMYKESNEAVKEKNRQSFLTLASNSLHKMLTERTIVETHKHGKVDKEGKVKPFHVKQVEKVVQPNAALIRMSMEALEGKFSKKPENPLDKMDDVYKYRDLTTDEIAEQMRAYNQKLANL